MPVPSCCDLEAGRCLPTAEEVRFPQGWPLLSMTEWNWGESSTVQTATGRVVPVPRGRGVGGSSLINGMIFMRGHHANYAAWDGAGAKGWAFDDLLPYFKRSETLRRGAIPRCGEPMVRSIPSRPLTRRTMC